MVVKAEQDRLDLQHHMLLIMLNGKLLLAPISPHVQDVLDIGTGTGIWAIEFGKSLEHRMKILIDNDCSHEIPIGKRNRNRFESNST